MLVEVYLLSIKQICISEVNEQSEIVIKQIFFFFYLFLISVL